jgi:EAL domain-containing protein (putative c-di-GMP-specific phosphodiesterase class I)
VLRTACLEAARWSGAQKVSVNVSAIQFKSLDQSFVRGRANGAVGRAIVRAVASLGQSLGIATVAEGVETEKQMARVGSDGCTDVQGYLISRPMPPNQIDGFLRSRNEDILRSE